MHIRWAPHRQTGFTIVELLIVIVVIGILAAIVIAAYNGVQKSASKSSMQSDLKNAAQQMGIAQVDLGVYPDVLPAAAKTSPGVTLTLVKRTGGYSGLNNVQFGVLFQTICQQIISEGYGTGTNIAGGVEQYITGCNVYNYNAMQINGWDSHNFSIPVAQGAVASWYNGNVSSDAFRPNKKSVYLAFANQLDSRFQALGGTFPVSSFWDPWANGSNGGVQYSTLPTPSAPSDPSNFCIEASHVKYTDVILHADQSSAVQSGPCP